MDGTGAANHANFYRAPKEIGISSELQRHVRTLLDQQRSPLPIGFVETALPSARLFWSDGPIARAPLSYDPGIAVIVAGRKIGFFEDRRIEYGPGQYLAIGLPMFFECETEASATAPLAGLFLTVEPSTLQDLARQMADHNLPTLPSQPGLGIEPLTMRDPVREAVTRLARQLTNPAEAAVLGPNTLREVFYHALQDSHGRVLLSQTRRNRPEARIAKLLADLDRAPDRFAGVESLAEAAGMSPASLHRHFKAVTGLSPLQYQKRKRLLRAKSLLTFGRLGVGEAARAVGYASATQFSRDFSAYFGIPPSRAELSPYPAEARHRAAPAPKTSGRDRPATAQPTQVMGR